MTRSLFRAALLALLAPLALAGCDSAHKPIAKVGDRLITVDDFVRAARGNEGQYSAVPEQAKAQFLDDLIKSELLVQAALSRGDDTTAAARNFRRALTARVTLQAFYERIAPTGARVSEAEARELWRWQKELSDAQVVYSQDRSLIEAAAAELRAGQPFGEVADKYNVPGVLPNGGALGFIPPGSLIAPLDDALRTQELDAVGGPYQTPQGWFLLRVRGRRAAEVSPYAQQAAALTERVRSRKRMQLLSSAMVALEREYRAELAYGAPQTLFRLLSSFSVAGAAEWEPSQAELSLPLATWDGGQYTLGDAIADLKSPDTQKPNASATPALDGWLHGMVRTRIALMDAQRRHLAEEPELKHQIDAEMSKYLAEGEYSAAILGVPKPEAATTRAMWDQLKVNYPQLDRVRVQYLALPDSALLAAVARHGGHGGGTLRDAARMANPSLQVREELVPFPNPDPQWGALQSQFMRMAPGDWSGPQPVEGGWLLLQLLDKSQGQREYDQLSPEMQQNLMANAWQLARNRRFEQFADSLRSVFKPTPVAENLVALPWPMPRRLDVGD